MWGVIEKVCALYSLEVVKTANNTRLKNSLKKG